MPNEHIITYSANPIFDLSLGNTQIITLSGDATPIVVDILGAAYSNGSALPSASLCSSGTKPTGNGASQYGNQAAWTCPTTATAANYDFVAKVVTAPTSSTNCSVTLEVLRY